MGQQKEKDLTPPRSMTAAEVWRLSRRAGEEWVEDGATSRGAAIAFYTMFSLAPLVLLVIALAGLLFGREAAQGAIIGEFRYTMGQEAAAALEQIVAQAGNTGDGLVATAAGIVLLLVGATSVLAELQSALNQIWRVAPLKVSGIWTWLRSRLLSLSLIGAAGFLLAVSLILSTILTALEGWIGRGAPEMALLIEVANLATAFILTAAFFAAIYKILPDVPLRWSDVIVGSLVTAVLFNIGKYAIAVYVSTSRLASSYGAAGALIVVFVWVFYSTQIFLLGAEFTKVYAARHGSKQNKDPVGRDQSET